MAHFEKVPERPSFDITDDYGHCANLTAEQAYDLLQWLYRSDELFQAVHPEAKQEQPSTWLAETHETMVQALDELVAKPEAVKAWQQAKPAVEAWQREHPFIPDSDEKPAVPTVRMLELRLYEADGWRYNELKRLIPTIHMEYEGPAAETGAPVRVYSVRADTLSQDAIRLLNETPLEWKFTDVLVPVAEEEDK